MVGGVRKFLNCHGCLNEHPSREKNPTEVSTISTFSLKQVKRYFSRWYNPVSQNVPQDQLTQNCNRINIRPPIVFTYEWLKNTLCLVKWLPFVFTSKIGNNHHAYSCDIKFVGTWYLWMIVSPALDSFCPYRFPVYVF